MSTTESPWRDLEAKKQQWAKDLVRIHVAAEAAGVRIPKVGPLVRVNEYGTLIVDLGLGIRATGHGVDALLEDLPRAVELLKQETVRRVRVRKAKRQARAEAAARLDDRRREAFGGKAKTPEEFRAFVDARLAPPSRRRKTGGTP